MLATSWKLTWAINILHWWVVRDISSIMYIVYVVSWVADLQRLIQKYNRGLLLEIRFYCGFNSQKHDVALFYLKPILTPFLQYLLKHRILILVLSIIHNAPPLRSPLFVQHSLFCCLVFSLSANDITHVYAAIHVACMYNFPVSAVHIRVSTACPLIHSYSLQEKIQKEIVNNRKEIECLMRCIFSFKYIV